MLQAFARERPAGVEALWVAPAPHWMPPEWLPALVAGRREAAQCLLPLAPLAAAAGVAFATGMPRALDAAARVLHLSDGRTAEYDCLSLADGPVPPPELLPGARGQALVAVPPEPWAQLLPAVAELARERVLDVVVAGSGERAFELALAFEQRLNGAGPERARVAWVCGPRAWLPGWPRRAREAAARALAARRITCFHEPAAAVQPGAVVLASGARLACDVPVLADVGGPPAWLAGSGLALDEAGFVSTAASGQSVSRPEVFVAGPATPGAALADNLRRAAGGGELRPLPRAVGGLRFLGLGAQGAVVAWAGVSVAGRWVAAWQARRESRAWAALAAGQAAAMPPVPAAPTRAA